MAAGLPAACTVPQAQAMSRALAAPGVCQELVTESGWTPDGFGRWVGGTLERNLMAVQPRPGHGQRDPAGEAGGQIR